MGSRSRWSDFCLCTYLVYGFLGVGLPIGTLLGAMVVSIIALRAVHWFHVPSHVLTIPSVIPLMPGILMYRLLFNIIDIDTLDVSNFYKRFKVV